LTAERQTLVLLLKPHQPSCRRVWPPDLLSLPRAWQFHRQPGDQENLRDVPEGQIDEELH
jgi:hypothetical protein